MTHDPDTYSPAEALGQAITRAEAAEAECRELREALKTQAICLENAYGTCNRLQMQVAEERREVIRLHAMTLGGGTDMGASSKEREFGHYVLAVLMETGPDAGDRLNDMVREAVRLRLARANVQAAEATDPWALPTSMLPKDDAP
jgi:hypothetical protein